MVPPKDSPYAELDNVILTPHIAGSTAEAQEAVGIQIAMQVREYLKLGVAQNAVNLPSLSHEEYVQLAPYIDLAGRLGAFLAQTGKGGIDAIHLIYGGALAEAKTDLVRNAAIEGLLQGSENVNRINATAVADSSFNSCLTSSLHKPLEAIRLPTAILSPFLSKILQRGPSKSNDKPAIVMR